MGEIVKNDRDATVRQAAIDRISDQSILVNIAKSDLDWSLRKVAFNKITDPSVLSYIAKNDKDATVRQEASEKAIEKIITSLNYSFNKLNAANNYKLIIPVLNSNVSNYSSLAALKIIPCDTILKTHYGRLEITVDYNQGSQEYTEPNKPYSGRPPTKYWLYKDYLIKVILDNSVKEFNYSGQRGATTEYETAITDMHEGTIEINEICDTIVAPLTRESLLVIAKKSDVKYLREAAMRMINK